MNFPKRVPVLAKPQEGSSMRNVSRAATTFALVDESMRTSNRSGKITIFCSQRSRFSFGVSLVLQSEITVLISVMGKRAATQGHGFVTPGCQSAQSEGVGPLANFAL